MQLQNGYVNDYVVIIFKHYINPCGAGVKPESVTWASFFVRVSLRFGGSFRGRGLVCGEGACLW